MINIGYLKVLGTCKCNIKQCVVISNHSKLNYQGLYWHLLGHILIIGCSVFGVVSNRYI